MVKEKQQAREEYHKHLKLGHQVAKGELSERSKDVMMLKIGNIRAKGSVRITVQLIQ